MTRKKWCWAGAASALAILVMWFLYRGYVAKDDAPRYLTTRVVREDIDDTVRATGVLQPVSQVEVGAQVSGQLKALGVHLGDRVTAGQWLGQIDPVVLRNTLREAQATEQNLVAQRRAVMSQLEQASRAYQRQQQMLRDQATARQDVENAQAQFNALQANIESFDAQVKEARIQVDTATINLGYARIVSPIAGEVVAVVTGEGQTVIAQQQAPVILKVANLDTMTVKAQVAEADVIRVHPGLPVYFTILGEPDRRYYGKLRAIEPAPQNYSDAAPESGGGDASKPGTAVFYNALFEVANPAHRLRISMTAEVGILLGSAHHALSIPEAALGEKNADGTYSVRVVSNDGKAVTHNVRIGINNDVKAEVLSGLKEGDAVVVGEPAGSDTDAASGTGD